MFSSNVIKAQLDSAQLAEQLSAFDFWVGNWEVSWLNPDSSYTYGTNVIEKTLDEKVIQEHFNDPSSGFKGTSISVFSIQDNKWHQSWADNAGGQFDFFGIVDGDKRIFQTEAKDRKGVLIIQRMRFHSINADNFIWDWESSIDEGETWKLVWQIFYERKQEE
jgi:hypothetical protein